jgi:MFS family permease
VAALAACFALNMFGRGLGDTYAVFLLPLEREFGWTRSQLAGVYSVYLLMHGVTSPLVGYFFDRFGPRTVYGCGLAFLGSAFVLAGSLTSLWQFYLLIGGLVGLGVSLNGMVTGSALLSRWFRTRLSTAIGIAFSATGFGTIVFVPLAQYLVAHYDWRVAYRTLGFLVLAVLPLAVLLLPWKQFSAGHPENQRRAKAKSAEEGWTLRSAARSDVFIGLSQAFFCTAAAMFSILVQMVAFLVDAGFTPLTAATAYGAVGLMSAASVMGSGFTSERFGYLRTVTVTFVGTATGMLFLLILTYHPSTALLVLFVPVFGLCMGVRGPIISSISARHFAGPHVATIYGTIYGMNALGAAFGALLGGFLHDLTGGYRAGLLVSLCFLALASSPFWTVRALRTFR